MHRATRWIITVAYCYSQLLGVISFSYDVETGYAQKKTHITIYCAILNLLTLSIIPYFVATMEVKPRPKGQADLHQKIYVVMILIRISGVLVTIISNWLKRNDFIRNLNDLQHFREDFLKKHTMLKKYENFYEKQILAKLFLGLVCELMMSSGTVRILRDTFEVQNPLILTTLGMLSAVLNMVTCHYLFISLSVHTMFSSIVGELKTILNSIGQLFRLQYAKRIGPGALVIQCCHLSDALDELSRAHLELQKLSDRINNMYYVQGLCLMLVLYMNNVCVIYMGYMVAHHENLWPQYDRTVFYVVPLALMFYYTDTCLFVYLLLHMVATIDAPIVLLKERQPWLPTLDERLERSLQNFSMQTAAFPLNRFILHLFEVSRPMVFATISSTLSNAIVLMQYDYKYSRR